jgi:hypothetical protein
VVEPFFEAWREPDRSEEADMKYVLEWTPRAGGSAQENLASMKRSLEVLSKWSPSTTVHQFVTRIDAQGGFAIAETDDPTAVARDCAIFSPYLNFTVYPVIDVEQGAAAFTAAVDFNETH